MDELEKTRRIAAAVRRALEEIDKSSLDRFNEFPHGACGDASMLLGTYLRRSSVFSLNYFSGERDGHSHGWLQRGELFVDITADQFKDGAAPVIVVMGSKWHAQFNGELTFDIADYQVVFGDDWELKEADARVRAHLNQSAIYLP